MGDVNGVQSARIAYLAPAARSPARVADAPIQVYASQWFLLICIPTVVRYFDSPRHFVFLIEFGLRFGIFRVVAIVWLSQIPHASAYGPESRI